MSDFGPEPIVIHEVVFDDRWVRITYQDMDHVTQRCQEITTVLVDPSLVPEQLANVIEELREILTAAAVERRAPAPQFTRP